MMIHALTHVLSCVPFQMVKLHINTIYTHIAFDIDFDSVDPTFAYS